MPYMTRPDTEIPISYGAKIVIDGELVLVRNEDVQALEAEGWKIEIDPESTTMTPIASYEDPQ